MGEVGEEIGELGEGWERWDRDGRGGTGMGELGQGWEHQDKDGELGQGWRARTGMGAPAEAAADIYRHRAPALCSSSAGRGEPGFQCCSCGISLALKTAAPLVPTPLLQQLCHEQ